MIVVKKDQVIIYNPMGARARKIIQTLFSKYGVEGEVKEVWCG